MIIMPIDQTEENSLLTARYAKKVIDNHKKGNDKRTKRSLLTRCINGEIVEVVEAEIANRYKVRKNREELTNWLTPANFAKKLTYKRSKIYANEVNRAVGSVEDGADETSADIFQVYTSEKKLDNALLKKDYDKHSINVAYMKLTVDDMQGVPLWMNLDARWCSLYSSSVSHPDRFTEFCQDIGKHPVGVDGSGQKRQLYFVQNNLEAVVVDNEGNHYNSVLVALFGEAYDGGVNPCEMQNVIAFRRQDCEGIDPVYDKTLYNLTVNGSLAYTELNNATHYQSYARGYSIGLKPAFSPNSASALIPLQNVDSERPGSIGQINPTVLIHERLGLISAGVKEEMSADGFNIQDQGASIEGGDEAKAISGVAEMIQKAGDQNYYAKEISDATLEENWIFKFIIKMHAVLSQVEGFTEVRQFENIQDADEVTDADGNTVAAKKIVDEEISFTVDFNIDNIVIDDSARTEAVKLLNDYAPVGLRQQYQEFRPDKTDKDIQVVFELLGIDKAKEEEINKKFGEKLMPVTAEEVLNGQAGEAGAAAGAQTRADNANGGDEKNAGGKNDKDKKDE